MSKLKIYLYSTQDFRNQDGGGNSSSTAYDGLRDAGHDISFYKSVSELEHAVSAGKPDLLLHHNLKDLEAVSAAAEMYGVPMVVTVNNLITCNTGVHLKYDSKFGTPCRKCSFCAGFYCQLTEKYIRPWDEKLRALILYPFRWYNQKKKVHILNKAAGIIAISPTLKQLLELGGVTNKIFVCPQPISADLGKKPKELYQSDKSIIFYQGAGEPFKGIRVLLKAFVKLNRKDAELLIAGDVRPANKIPMQQLQQKHKNIKFLGELPYAEMKKYYHSADIFVFPSLWLEAYGRGWAEAACTGKPIIAFKDRGGPSDYLRHMDTAYLADTDMDSLTGALNKLLNDAKLRNKLGHNAKAFAQKELISPKVILKLENIYGSVLK